jgi:hypothetical protein
VVTFPLAGGGDGGAGQVLHSVPGEASRHRYAPALRELRELTASCPTRRLCFPADGSSGLWEATSCRKLAPLSHCGTASRLAGELIAVKKVQVFDMNSSTRSECVTEVPPSPRSCALSGVGSWCGAPACPRHPCYATSIALHGNVPGVPHQRSPAACSLPVSSLSPPACGAAGCAA